MHVLINVHFFIMNIAKLKKQYDKIFKITVENIDIYYKPFTAKEMIFLMKSGNEEKYKYDIIEEAVINKDDLNKLKNWASKELIYKNILNISNLGTDEEIINKKLLIKNDLEKNPFLIMIKRIIQILPIVKFNDLLDCTADQLLFYIVLCESFIGKDIISTTPEIPTIIPSTKKKTTLNTEDLINLSTDSSIVNLKETLSKHGAKVKEFIPKSFEPKSE